MNWASRARKVTWRYGEEFYHYVRSRATILKIGLILCLVFALAWISTMVIAKFALSTSKTQITSFILLVSYSSVFVSSYIFFEEVRRLVKLHAGLTTIISIVLPIMLLSFQISANTLSSSIDAEDNIKQANNYNYKLAVALGDDIKKAQATYFFLAFDSDTYKTQRNYITNNYSVECRNAYIVIMASAEEMNRLENQVEALNISHLQLTSESQTNEFEVKMLANKTLRLTGVDLLEQQLSFVMNKCQDFKQRED